MGFRRLLITMLELVLLVGLLIRCMGGLVAKVSCLTFRLLSSGLVARREYQSALVVALSDVMLNPDEMLID